MVSQRQHRRFDASVHVTVSTDGRSLKAHTETISRGGMFVTTQAPFRHGRDVWAHLNLPTGEVKIPGVVAYVVDVEPRLGRGMGIRFHDVTPTSETSLSDYIETLARRHQGSVLLVDDDQPTMELYRTALRERDYSVRCARDYFSALDTLRYGEISVVVAEAQMRRMDGLDLAETIRRANSEIELVLLSRGPLGTDQAKRARKLKVATVLQKPFNLDMLAQAVDLASLTRETHRRPTALDPEDSPWDAATVDVKPVTADIAELRLQQLGCVTRRSANGAVFGQLLFLYHRIHLPFDAQQAVPRVRMGTVGLDHVQIYVPKPLTAIPKIPILTMPNQLALERAIANAVGRRERDSMDVRRWFESMDVQAKLDKNRFCCMGQVLIEGESAVFSATSRREIILEKIRGYSVRDALGLEDRRISMVGVFNAADLRERLDPAFQIARMAVGPDPFDER
jgi:uncharacterized protein (TIGR02266 family)